MIRIAYVIGGLPFGGVENWLFDIALRLKGMSSHQCRIFNVSGTGLKLPEFQAAGLDVVCIGRSDASTSTHRFDTVLRLRRELKKYSPDIVHTLHFGGDYFGRLASLGLGASVVTHIRNVKREKKFFRRFANKALSFVTDAFLATSRAVDEIIDLDHNVFHRTKHVLHNAVDTGRLDCEPHDLHAMCGLRGRILLGLGRFYDQKNFEGAIRALKILVDEGRDVSLVLVGDGRKWAVYDALALQLGLHDRVALTGYRRDVGAFLRGADILVMPSLFEGFGNVHLEAMHCGLPAVVSRFVPSLEIAAEAAVVCECSPQSIAAGVAELLDDPQRCRQLVEAGRRIIGQHTMDRYLGRLLGVYDEVLPRSGR